MSGERPAQSPPASPPSTAPHGVLWHVPVGPCVQQKLGYGHGPQALQSFLLQVP